LPLHVSLAIEALSPDPQALILSIGAAKFDPWSDDIAESFHLGVDIEHMPDHAYSFKIAPRVVAEWLTMERSVARDDLARTSKVDLASALEGFAHWLGADSLPMWSVDLHHATLRRAYDVLGLDAPWQQEHDRGFHTFVSLAPSLAFERVGPEHSAAGEAIGRALHIQKIVKALGIKEPSNVA
jgi:hypothetical protein